MIYISEFTIRASACNNAKKAAIKPSAYNCFVSNYLKENVGKFIAACASKEPGSDAQFSWVIDLVDTVYAPVVTEFEIKSYLEYMYVSLLVSLILIINYFTTYLTTQVTWQSVRQLKDETT